MAAAAATTPLLSKEYVETGSGTHHGSLLQVKTTKQEVVDDDGRFAATTTRHQQQHQQQQQQYPLSIDLQEMIAYGSLMFVLNELRKFSDGRLPIPQENKESSSSSSSSSVIDRSKFEPILKFPLSLWTMEKVVKENANLLKELQGESRFQSHLQMFDFFHKLNDEDDEGSVLFLDYNEDYDKTKTTTTKDGEDSHLCYSIVLDHPKKRITVVFRGSATSADWKANINFRHIIVENPLYGNNNNDAEQEEQDYDQPETMILHRGFYEYVHETITDEHGQSKTKMEEIVEKLMGLLQTNPGYEIFTTGVSLGGALTQVFAFYAAAWYPALGPITCYTFASPKIGTLSFRLALLQLEKQRRLKILRAVNWGDPVVLLPRDPLTIIPWGSLLLNTFFVGLRQSVVYRHVGMRLFMFRRRKTKAPLFNHVKIEYKPWRIFLSDLGKLWGRLIVIVLQCLMFWNTFRENYLGNHGYPEYWYRVQTNLPAFQDLTLQLLYDEFLAGDRTRVKTRFGVI